MSNKQTAVEQFAIALYEKGLLKGNGDDIQELLEQAKEMHKQEIIDAYTEGRFNYEDFDRGLVKLKQPKEYYQKTFNNKNGTSNQTT